MSAEAFLDALRLTWRISAIEYLKNSQMQRTFYFGRTISQKL